MLVYSSYLSFLESTAQSSLKKKGFFVVPKIVYEKTASGTLNITEARRKKVELQELVNKDQTSVFDADKMCLVVNDCCNKLLIGHCLHSFHQTHVDDAE